MALLNKRFEDHVLIVELARADRGNALNRALTRELIEAWEAFENDDEMRVAVLQGSSEVFSIGHDVNELTAGEAALSVPDPALYPLRLSKPVIAAIEGPCYGLGFELALACDLRVAGERAQFGFVDSNLFVPYRVASVLLPRMTHLGASLDLLCSGRILGANAMRKMGLISELAGAGEAAARATALAHSMIQRSRNSDFRKQAIWRLSGMPLPAAMAFARSPR